MPLKTRPRLEDFTIVEWLDARADRLDKQYPDKAPHLRGSHFVEMVGQDTKKPIVDKSNLARAFKYESRNQIYILLKKLEQERRPS